MVALVVAFFLQSAPATALTVEQIMARVAENQDRAQDARTQWVYQQDVLVRMHRSNGKLAREESSQFLVTPTPTGIDRKLQQFAGKYERGGKFFDYDKPHYEYKGIDIDGDIISDVADDLIDEKKSKDGVAHDMFPLTAKEQAKYDFTLEAREEYRGRDTYRVSFKPKPKQEDGADWKGEAVIDAAEFQPVVITTSLAWGIPGAVKVLLGTDIHHVGFKVTYKKVEDGVWFPSVYGGELYVKGLFLYKRNISVSVKNEEFHKTDVATTITFETPH